MANVRKKNFPLSLVAGFVMFGILVLIAIFAPIFLSGLANTLSPESLAAPSAAHWFGTDNLGRDIIARSLVATRLTLLMSLAATVLSVVVGVFVGGAVWLGPRWLREVVLRVIDSTVAFPALILDLVIAAILGPAASSAVIAIGIAGIPSFARITSNMTAPVIQRDFMRTSQLMGVPASRLFVRHLLPNIGGPLLILIASSFALSLLEISSLSFVGLGVQSPQYDWGRLLSEGLPAIYSQPLQVLAPSAMLIFAGVAAMLTGDGLAQKFDPWGKQARAERPRVKGAAAVADNTSALVEVKNLSVTAANGTVLVKGIDFEIAPGEILGLVGESGSGKSMTAMSLAQLHPDSVAVSAELMRVGSLDILTTNDRSRLAKDIGLVYQDPGSTFNPALRMGVQLTEVARVHMGLSRRAARSTLVQGLQDMRIRRPETVMTQHPFQLSGGMLQRAIIASSLVTDPRLIIADEPTTALDVTVQAEVSRQFKAINQKQGTAILFISHDIGVVQALCDRVLVMRNGEIIERLTGEELALEKVSHPYTKALLAATPRLKTSSNKKAARKDGL
jgi:ABC-type dipeptide/oligopeptide/nickel transport system ATPase component/ABC-type dipeptide/oligopeptide/nickel transport system permease subunit